MGARVHTSSTGCGPCLFPGGSWPGHHRGGGWRRSSGGCSCVDVNVLRTAGKPVGLPGQPSRLVAAAPPLSKDQDVPQPSSPFPRPPGAQLRPQSFSWVPPSWASLGSILVNAVPGTSPGFYSPEHFPSLSIFPIYSAEAGCAGIGHCLCGKVEAQRV